jgi:hypothetical protein
MSLSRKFSKYKRIKKNKKNANPTLIICVFSRILFIYFRNKNSEIIPKIEPLVWSTKHKGSIVKIKFLVSFFSRYSSKNKTIQGNRENANISGFIQILMIIAAGKKLAIVNVIYAVCFEILFFKSKRNIPNMPKQ